MRRNGNQEFGFECVRFETLLTCSFGSLEEAVVSTMLEMRGEAGTTFRLIVASTWWKAMILEKMVEGCCGGELANP